jgi:exoribonuclease R
MTNAKSNMDSHDVVSYWMIQMNRVIGKRLATKYKTGIFRKAGYNDAQKKHDSTHNEMQSIEDEDMRRVVNGWKNSTGVYCLFSETDDMVHEFLNAEYYTHITSPIRRIVDLLNQMMFLTCEFGITLNEQAQAFLTHWTTDTMIERMNETMRSIRKVEMECERVSKCNAHPEWMQHEHKGIVFDRIDKMDSTCSYMVYLPKKEIISRVNSLKTFENYTIHDFVLTISPIDQVIRVGFSSRIC